MFDCPACSDWFHLFLVNPSFPVCKSGCSPPQFVVWMFLLLCLDFLAFYWTSQLLPWVQTFMLAGRTFLTLSSFIFNRVWSDCSGVFLSVMLLLCLSNHWANLNKVSYSQISLNKNNHIKHKSLHQGWSESAAEAEQPWLIWYPVLSTSSTRTASHNFTS